MNFCSDKAVVFVCALAIVLAGCRKRDDIPDPKPIVLAPIDVVLKLNVDAGDPTKSFYEFHQTRSYSSYSSFDVTESNYDLSGPISKAGAYPDWLNARDTISNKRIDNIHVFAFHKYIDTIVRHFYNEYPNPLDATEIKMPQMYIGDYDIFIVANAGNTLTIGGGSETITLPEGKYVTTCWTKHAKEDIENLYIERLGLFGINENAKGIPRSFKGEIKFKKYGENDDILIVASPLAARSTFKIDIKTNRVSDLMFNKIFYESVARKSFVFKDNATSSWAHLGEYFNEIWCRENQEDMSKYSKIIISNISIGNIRNQTKLTFKGKYKDESGKEQNIGYCYTLNNGAVLSGVDYFYNFTFKDPDFNDPRVFSFNVMKENFKTDADKEVPDEGNVSCDASLSKEIPLNGKNITSPVLLSCYLEGGEKGKGKFSVFIKVEEVWKLVVEDQSEISNQEIIPYDPLVAGFDEVIKVVYKRGGETSATTVAIQIDVKVEMPSENISVGQKVKFVA